MSFLAWVTLACAVLAGCQRVSGCPPQMDPLPGKVGPGLWCRARAGGRVDWIEHHPGTREARRRCTFEGGVAEGQFLATHPGGKRWLIGQYRSGQKEGLWVQWDADGNKVAEGRYTAGRLVAGAPVGLPADCETRQP